MKLSKGFSLIEVMVILLLVVFLSALSIYTYKHYIEKAISTEAMVSVGAIKDAEEFHKITTGTYVAAEDTEQINERLDLDIVPKYYEYEVVGVTDDNFIIIARRIGADLKEYITAEKLPPRPMVIAMDKSGIIDSGYGQYLGIGGGAGGEIGTTGVGGAGTGGIGGTGGGFGGSTDVGGGAGTGAGGAGTGTAGGETGGGTGIPGGGIPFLGGEEEAVYDPEIREALNLLKDNATNLSLGDTIGYYYELITERNISVIYANPSLYGVEGAIGWWMGPGYGYNTIYVNEDYKTTSPESAIAAVIAHEATHADYDYNPEKWLAIIEERYPDVDTSKIIEDDYLYVYNPETETYEEKPHLRSSVTQEYFAFSNGLETWQELKNGDSDDNQDAWLVYYLQGEDIMRDAIRATSDYSDLPEY